MGGSGINYGPFTLVHVFRYLKTIIFAILNECLVRLSHQNSFFKEDLEAPLPEMIQTFQMLQRIHLQDYDD